MDEKISLQEVEKFSRRFTARLLDVVFRNKPQLTGEDLLGLSEIGQVNYFVLAELFTRWNREREKLTSPYFDYSAPEVKEALDNLMGVLSNNISISRKDLEPMVVKAVHDTLLVAFAPYDFYTHLIEGENNELNVGEFATRLKYLKINKPPLEKLLEAITAQKKQRIRGSEAFAILDRILEEVNFTPDDVDVFVEQFSRVEQLDLKTLYVAIKPVVKAKAPASVNEKISLEPKRTLADDFQRIPKIKDRLTINQKFMFTKVLFESDFEAFSKVVDDLDKLDNYQDALNYLDPHLQKWDKESEEFAEFFELIEKRFA